MAYGQQNREKRLSPSSGSDPHKQHFIGTKDLMLALAKIGRNPDTGLGAGGVAYRLIHNDTFPSWGFSIKHGATSIWERWNGWTPENGVGVVGARGEA